MKIAICGLIKDENLGEKFISDSLSWIIEDVIKESNSSEICEFVEVDLKARNDVILDYTNQKENKIKNYYNYDSGNILFERIDNRLKRLSKKINNKLINNLIYKIKGFLWKYGVNYRKRYYSYYESKLKDVKLIVVDGAGLLEYSFNEYQETLNLLSEYAEKYKIPLVCNAVGRAGEFDPKDYRCQILMKTFQRNCVKYVSARDSVEDVQQCVGSKFKVKLLADAAMCSEEAYGISKDANSEIVGIGIIRGTALQSYKVDFTPEDWINLYADIAVELKNRGYNFQFFTNGKKSDYNIGVKVLDKLNLDKSYLVERPTDAKVLFETISGYKGLITCRMHSSIAAFSMGIPSVILSWNKKVNKYMDISGYPDRAINIENFNAKYIVDKFEESLKEGISDENRNRMKSLARESVEDYIDLIIEKGEK